LFLVIAYLSQKGGRIVTQKFNINEYCFNDDDDDTARILGHR